MLALQFLLLLGVVVADDDSGPIVSKAYNAASGRCTYTLSIPDGNCASDADPKMSARLDALEKEFAANKLQGRQQQLFATEMNFKIQTQAARIEYLEEIVTKQGLGNKKYKDCAEYKLAGRRDDGVYNITLEHALSGPISVWCDMQIEEGGWTLFQRRQDGSVDFYRDWTAYKKGFGNVDGEFWLGNDYLYHLTNQKKYQLRVDLWDFDDNHYWAEYDDFYIDNELLRYALHVGKYNGTAGDALTYHNKAPFITKYEKSDGCAKLHKSGFWFYNCLYTNLNGVYHNDRKYERDDAVSWYQIRKDYKALKKTEMKVRPMTYHRK